MVPVVLSGWDECGQLCVPFATGIEEGARLRAGRRHVGDAAVDDLQRDGRFLRCLIYVPDDVTYFLAFEEGGLRVVC